MCVCNPQESVFGSGDSHIRTVSILHYDTASDTYTDKTSTMTLSTSPTDYMFPYATAGSMLYIGSGLEAFPGIKLDCDGLMNYTGDGVIVAEIWTGAAWTNIPFMTTRASPDYARQCQQIGTAASQQVRFGDVSAWRTTTVNSVADKYWLRFRITSDLDTMCKVSRIKVHTNRTEINADGFMEFFGNARPLIRLPYDLGLTEAAANSPANGDVYSSSTIGVGRVENSFQDAVTDTIGFVADFPSGIDTSYPMTLVWRFIGTSAPVGTQDIYWTIRWLITSDYSDTVWGDDSTVGDSSGDAGVKARQKSTTVTSSIAAANKQYRATAELDVNFFDQDDVIAPRLLWVSISREAGDALDTYGGTVNMIQLTPTYVAWRLGIHVLDGAVPGA